MTWYASLACVIGGAVAIGFWGWVAVSIIGLQKDIAVLRQQQRTTAEESETRLVWLRQVEAKVDRIAEAVARIEGLLSRTNRQEQPSVIFSS